jgi:undecaprenyl-diphosphatase
MDTQLFLYLNGLTVKAPFIGWFFRGISNDYFSIIICCLILVWLWFGTRGADRRQIIQQAIIITIISVLLANILVAISNNFYFRIRPFNQLAPGTVNLLFYPPTDSTFPSNLAATLFSLAIPIFIKNKAYGSVLLVTAALCSIGRIFIGIHYPLDILGGAVFGAAGAFLAVWINRWILPQINLLLRWLRKIYLA